jgi:hypothetical protein
MGKTLFRVIRLAPGLALTGVLMSPMTAVAEVSSVQVVSAHMVAKGVEVDVTVSFTCTEGHVIGNFGMAGITASVQQAVSKTQQASGFGGGGDGTVCTGEPQTFVVQVLADRSGPPFRTGPAVINATVVDQTDSSFRSSGYTTVRITH